MNDLLREINDTIDNIYTPTVDNELKVYQENYDNLRTNILNNNRELLNTLMRIAPKWYDIDPQAQTVEKGYTPMFSVAKEYNQGILNISFYFTEDYKTRETDWDSIDYLTFSLVTDNYKKSLFSFRKDGTSQLFNNSITEHERTIEKISRLSELKQTMAFLATFAHDDGVIREDFAEWLLRITKNIYDNYNVKINENF